MQAILIGGTAALLVAVIMGLALPTAREPAYRAFATTSVRVGEPSGNLVGHSWETSRLHKEF